MLLTDKFGRPITDLRISITDHCNYKCVYCRTGNDGAQYADLPFADYLRMARVFAGLGIKKVRLTGGEPLTPQRRCRFRPRSLATCAPPTASPSTSPSPPTATCSPNSRSRSKTPAFTASPSAWTPSIPTASPASPASRMATTTCSPASAPRKRAGLEPVKVNCVLLRGFNEDQIIPFGMFAREEDVVVRFIEFMPLEEDRIWTPGSRGHPRRNPRAHGRVPPAGRDPARALRDRPPLPLRRRHRRNRHHRPRLASLLRTLQPRPPHLRRQNPHLPVLRLGSRPPRRKCVAAPPMPNSQTSSAA